MDTDVRIIKGSGASVRLEETTFTITKGDCVVQTLSYTDIAGAQLSPKSTTPGAKPVDLIFFVTDSFAGTWSADDGVIHGLSLQDAQEIARTFAAKMNPKELAAANDDNSGPGGWTLSATTGLSYHPYHTEDFFRSVIHILIALPIVFAIFAAIALLFMVIFA